MNESMLLSLGLSPNALRDQVAVISGAGRGIGCEAAQALAVLGARVVIAELAETGREVEASIKAGGGQALWVQTDVADAESVMDLLRRTHAAFGPVDILVNNAIISPVASVTEMDIGLWDQVIAVNLRGAFLTCRAFLPDMLARGNGIIVNMVSTDAMPGMAAYIASKQGLVGLSQSLALEVGEQGVRVVAFAPGMVDTPGIRDVSVGLAPRLGMARDTFLSATLHPAYENRLMPAEDAGAATAYLVAKLAAEYHGEVVNGYEVLERAGYLHAPGMEADLLEVAPAVAAAGLAATPALALVERLQDMLAATETEFDKLPIFARPLARRGFKAKSGQSLQVWAQTLADLHLHIDDRPWLRREAARLQALLEKLAVYFHEVPQETARFTRDSALLQEVRRIAVERESTALQLRDILSADRS